MPLEIERKFILSYLPEDLNLHTGQYLRQGYPTLESDRETRLRVADDKYSLTIKNGSGLKRSEWESRLSKEQFFELWPSCEDRRLEKFRFHYPLDRHKIELDLYLGSLKGLAVAEVEFDDPTAAKAFTPPEWFGKELTGKETFTSHYLATHKGKEVRRQIDCYTDLPMEIGVIPYRLPGVLHRSLNVLMITNRSGEKRILPKGQPEEDLSKSEVALMEAWEEAGIRGSISGPSIEIPYRKNGDVVIMKYYPMKIEKSLKKWPEKHFRMRHFFTFEQAQEHSANVAVRVALFYLQRFLREHAAEGTGEIDKQDTD